MFFFREICENFMPSLLFNGNILANNIVHQLNRSVCSPVIVHPWIFFLDAYHLFIVYRLLVNECFLFYLDITVCPYRNIFLWLGKTCIKHKFILIITQILQSSTKCIQHHLHYALCPYCLYLIFILYIHKYIFSYFLVQARSADYFFRPCIRLCPSEIQI